MNEMKRVMMGKPTTADLPEMVDGVTGQDEIAEKFKEVYEKLYNSSDSSKEMIAIEERIKELMKTQNNELEIVKVATDIV